MAHQLRTQGEEVALLAMLDTFAPTFLQKTRMDQVRWFVRGARANGAPFLVRWLRLKLQRRLRRFNANLKDLAQARELPGEDSTTVDMGEAFISAQSRYVLRPLDLAVDMFRATDRTEEGYVPRDMGWKPYALLGVRLWEVSGGHQSMCVEPHVRELAHLLQSAIAGASTAVARHEESARIPLPR
jgi:thioesterase domain-containing protein